MTPWNWCVQNDSSTCKTKLSHFLYHVFIAHAWNYISLLVIAGHVFTGLGFFLLRSGQIVIWVIYVLYLLSIFYCCSWRLYFPILFHFLLRNKYYRYKYKPNTFKWAQTFVNMRDKDQNKSANICNKCVHLLRSGQLIYTKSWQPLKLENMGGAFDTYMLITLWQL